jgi:hypothetical protein
MVASDAWKFHDVLELIRRIFELGFEFSFGLGLFCVLFSKGLALFDSARGLKDKRGIGQCSKSPFGWHHVLFTMQSCCLWAFTINKVPNYS